MEDKLGFLEVIPLAEIEEEPEATVIAGIDLNELTKGISVIYKIMKK